MVEQSSSRLSKIVEQIRAGALGEQVFEVIQVSNTLPGLLIEGKFTEAHALVLSLTQATHRLMRYDSNTADFADQLVAALPTILDQQFIGTPLEQHWLYIRDALIDHQDTSLEVAVPMSFGEKSGLLFEHYEPIRQVFEDSHTTWRWYQNGGDERYINRRVVEDLIFNPRRNGAVSSGIGSIVGAFYQAWCEDRGTEIPHRHFEGRGGKTIWLTESELVDFLYFIHDIAPSRSNLPGYKLKEN